MSDNIASAPGLAHGTPRIFGNAHTLGMAVSLGAIVSAAFLLSPAAAMAATNRQPVRVVVIGDSNVEGRAVRRSATYPAQLQTALRRNGYYVRVFNRGVYGDRVNGVLRRIDDDVPRGTSLAVVWVGINDARYGSTASEIDRGHAAIRRKLSRRGIPSVFIVPPVYDVSLHRNSDTRVSILNPHMNALGYSIMVRRTYPLVAGALRKAGVRKSRAPNTGRQTSR